MALAHAAIDVGDEVPVKLAVLGILIPLRMIRLVLVPKKSQGHPFSLHLLLHQGPVRLCPDGIGANDRRVKKSLQRGVVQPLRQGPGQGGLRGTLQTLCNGTSGKAATGCNGSVAEL
jgi:hypothetical protein